LESASIVNVITSTGTVASIQYKSTVPVEYKDLMMVILIPVYGDLIQENLYYKNGGKFTGTDFSMTHNQMSAKQSCSFSIRVRRGGVPRQRPERGKTLEPRSEEPAQFIAPSGSTM
jgi:hypothetical protein